MAVVFGEAGVEVAAEVEVPTPESMFSRRGRKRESASVSGRGSPSQAPLYSLATLLLWARL